MKYRLLLRVVVIVVACSASGYIGCAAPKPCTVTPVDIEEIKSDIRDIDAKLAEDSVSLAKLQEDVRTVRAQIEERRVDVPRLQAELDSVKMASGVSVKPPSETQPADSTVGPGTLGGGR